MNARLFALSLSCSLLGGEPLIAQTTTQAVVQAGHLDPVISAAFSRDSKLVATASADKTTKVWHVATGSLLQTFAGHTEGVLATAFSPDGKVVVTGGTDTYLLVRNALTGRTERSLGNAVGKVYALAFSKNGEYLAMAGGHTKVIVLETETWKEHAQLGGLTDPVNCLAFSANGKGYRLATGDKDGTIHIWNVGNQKDLHAFEKVHRMPKGAKREKDVPEGVLALAFSPDGKTLASGGVDGTVKLWDAINFKPGHTLKGHAGRVTGVGFVNPNLLVTTGEDNTVRFWNPATGASVDPKEKPEELAAKVSMHGSLVSPDGQHLLVIFGGRPRVYAIDAVKKTVSRPTPLTGLRDRGYSAAISPDGSAIAVGMNETVSLWRPGTSRELVTLHGLAGPVFGLAFSKNSKLLATVSTNSDDRSFIRIFDVATGKSTSSTFAHNARSLSIAFSPNGKYLATASSARSVGVWGVNETGELLKKPPFTLAEPKTAEHFYSVAFSPDGKWLAGGSYGRIVVWEVPSGKIWHAFETANKTYSLALAWSPDGKSLATGNDFGFARVWDVENKKPRFAINSRPGSDTVRAEDAILGITFSPDGKTLMLAHSKAVTLWDAANGKPIPDAKGNVKRLLGHTHLVRSLGFGVTKDNRTYLMTGSGDIEVKGNGDGLVKLWEFDQAKGQGRFKALCTLVSYWDAATGAASWAVIDPDARYDAPRAGDVPWLHFVLDNEPIALTQLKDKYYEPHLLGKILGLNPEPVRAVKELSAPKLPPKVEVKAKDAKAKTVTLSLTDKGGGVGRVQVLVNGKEVPDDAQASKPGGEVMVDLSKTPLRGRGDKVRVVTWNKDGTVASRGAEFDFEVAGPAPAPHKAELYAIVVGVSKFANPRLELQYAAKDAEEFAAHLKTGGARLFGPKGVHVTLLTSPGANAATKENIEAAFKEIAEKAQAEDVVLVFFAGHGVTVPGQDLYCYLTANAAALNPAALAAPAARGTVVTSEDLVQWIRPVKAGNLVMILDTCAAGGAATRLVPSSQIRSVETLSARTGFHILMGCAANKVSYETNSLQHGLVTYSLLEGMQGAGIRSGDRVEVTHWFHHAWYMVPKLAGGIGGIQEPRISSPDGNPFYVAELSAAEREAIKLPQPALRLCRPRLTNSATDGDSLGLEDRVEAVLDDRSASRGDPFTFVPCVKLANAYHPVGRYEVKGNQVTVTLRVELNGKEVTGRPLSVKGTKDKPEELARNIAKALAEWARK